MLFLSFLFHFCSDCLFFHLGLEFLPIQLGSQHLLFVQSLVVNCWWFVVPNFIFLIFPSFSFFFDLAFQFSIVYLPSLSLFDFHGFVVVVILGHLLSNTICLSSLLLSLLLLQPPFLLYNSINFLLFFSDPSQMIHLFLQNHLPFYFQLFLFNFPLLFLLFKLLHLVLVGHELIHTIYTNILQLF